LCYQFLISFTLGEESLEQGFVCKLTDERRFILEEELERLTSNLPNLINFLHHLLEEDIDKVFIEGRRLGSKGLFELLIVRVDDEFDKFSQ